MASRWRVLVACAVALSFALSGVECAVAQGPAQDALPQTTTDALHAMAQMAGAIFTGQVVAVRRLAAENGATGVVEIAFAVEDAVRGVSGSIYTVREWAGLWPAGDQPFCVGQRYLMLLHAPSAAGLSSPVGGMDGAIPVRGGVAAGPQTALASETVASGAAIAGTSAQAAAPVDGRVVDLRWVATRVVQPLSYRAGPVTHPIGRPISVHADAVNADAMNAVTPQPASGAGARGTGASSLAGAADGPVAAAAADSQSRPYTAVLEMLRSWEKLANGAR